MYRIIDRRRYYYTQFVGDPNDKPVIKGSANFSGIALIDVCVENRPPDGPSTDLQ